MEGDELSDSHHCCLIPTPSPSCSSPKNPKSPQSLRIAHNQTHYYCTLLFTENTGKAFHCSFSKLIHSLFFFFFLAQRNYTDGPQGQPETHNKKTHPSSPVQGHPQDSDRQTDRQHHHRLEKVNKAHIHLTVRTCSLTSKVAGGWHLCSKGEDGCQGQEAGSGEGETPFLCQ